MGGRVGEYTCQEHYVFCASNWYEVYFSDIFKKRNIFFNREEVALHPVSPKMAAISFRCCRGGSRGAVVVFLRFSAGTGLRRNEYSYACDVVHGTYYILCTCCSHKYMHFTAKIIYFFKDGHSYAENRSEDERTHFFQVFFFLRSYVASLAARRKEAEPRVCVLRYFWASFRWYHTSRTKKNGTSPRSLRSRHKTFTCHCAGRARVVGREPPQTNYAWNAWRQLNSSGLPRNTLFSKQGNRPELCFKVVAHSVFMPSPWLLQIIRCLIIFAARDHQPQLIHWTMQLLKIIRADATRGAKGCFPEAVFFSAQKKWWELEPHPFLTESEAGRRRSEGTSRHKKKKQKKSWWTMLLLCMDVKWASEIVIVSLVKSRSPTYFVSCIYVPGTKLPIRRSKKYELINSWKSPTTSGKKRVPPASNETNLDYVSK